MSLETPAVIAQARRLLKDETPATYRWSAEQLDVYLLAATQALYRDAPYAFLDEYATAIAPYPEVIVSPIPVSTVYLQPLACHIAASALMEDSADSANLQQAQVFMAQYKEGA